LSRLAAESLDSGTGDVGAGAARAMVASIAKMRGVPNFMSKARVRIEEKVEDVCS